MCTTCDTLKISPQIIYAPGDIINFYGSEYTVVIGNPDGSDTVVVELRNGVRLTLWVFPSKGISKKQPISACTPS